MVNRSKAKGTAAETAVVEYLRGFFPIVERRALSGGKDKGDLAGIPNFVGEIKNCKTLDLAGWVDELEVEMNNADVGDGAVIHKRRGTTNVGDWYATMPVSVLVELLLARRWT